MFTNSKLSRKNEFDRKAAVLRRLNMAEELFNDIQKTPKPAVSQIDEANRRYWRLHFSIHYIFTKGKKVKGYLRMIGKIRVWEIGQLASLGRCMNFLGWNVHIWRKMYMSSSMAYAPEPWLRNVLGISRIPTWSSLFGVMFRDPRHILLSPWWVDFVELFIIWYSVVSIWCADIPAL